MEEFHWRPCIEVVEKCLNSWHSRALSFSGKAIASNALALSRVWYVVSLVPMPPWALAELNSLVFKFFWSGKKDLVARDVVIHACKCGGFSVVSTAFKVQSLLVQWIKRFASSPSGWVGLMSYWFRLYFDATPFAVGGSGSSSGLFVAALSPDCISVDSISCKLCYHLLLSFNPCCPHCVSKFRSAFPALDWPSTWRSLSFMPLDRKVIDLNWKIAHVSYTLQRGLFRLAMTFLELVFVASILRVLSICSFRALLLRVVFPGLSHFFSGLPLWLRLYRHIICYLVSVVTSFVVFQGFSLTF